MRYVHCSTLALIALSGSLATACGNTVGGDSASISQGETASSSTAPTSSSVPAPGGSNTSGDDSQPGLVPTETPAAEQEPETEPATPAQTSMTDDLSPMATDAETDDGTEDDGLGDQDTDAEPEPEPEAVEECTDIPDPEQTCQQRLEWGNCEQQWMIDAGYCNRTCGRCNGASNGDQDSNEQSPGGDSMTLGDDNPYPPIQGGQQGNSTRYWDCCKQSCGWTANASQPVSSCDYGGNNIGVNDGDRNVCDGGNATTCHGMAPWAHSTQVAYGYAAANGAGCGTCWQLQFTGTSSTTPGDQGSSAIAGKTMVVMATNIGDLNGNLHFDLLIPGGGLGLNNGCTTSLGIPANELGANRGGFLTECAGAGDLEAKKGCVRDKCTSVFGSRGLTELEDGCLWFVDWFQVADNPDFLVQQIDCPQELRQFN